MVNASEIIEGKIQKGIYRMAKKFGSDPYSTQILIGVKDENFVYKVLTPDSPAKPITFKEFMDIGLIDFMNIEGMFNGAMAPAFAKWKEELAIPINQIWVILSLSPLDEQLDKLHCSLYKANEHAKDITVEEITSITA